MAKSQQKTKVAQLRAAIDVSAEEFAKMVGKTAHTIGSLESGRLKLSEGLAARINIETSVDMGWLLDPSVGGPPVDEDGLAITKEHFERYRALFLMRDVEFTPEVMAERAIYQGELLRYMLQAIHDPQHYSLANYLVARFLRELRRRFQIYGQLEDLKKKSSGPPKKASRSDATEIPTS